MRTPETCATCADYSNDVVCRACYMAVVGKLEEAINLALRLEAAVHRLHEERERARVLVDRLIPEKTA